MKPLYKLYMQTIVNIYIHYNFPVAIQGNKKKKAG